MEFDSFDSVRVEASHLFPQIQKDFYLLVGNKHLEHIFGCSPSKRGIHHRQTKRYVRDRMDTF